MRLFLEENRNWLLGSLPPLLMLQGLQFLIPLLTVPFLSRVLGVGGWGQLAYMAAFGQIVIMAVDYGFHMSGTRAVAQARNAPDRLARIVAGVYSAKILLATLVVAGGAAVAIFVPSLSADTALFWAAIAAAVLQGFDPIWYFLGTEQARAVGFTSAFVRLLAVPLLYLTVRRPEDAWLYFGTQALAWAVIAAIGLVLIRRQFVGFHLSLAAARVSLRMGWQIFQVHAAGSGFDSAVPLVLGLLTSPIAVGYLSGADKIARAGWGLIVPLRLAVFPRFSYLATQSRRDGTRLLRQMLVIMSLVGVSVAVALFLGAGELVRLLLGPGFEGSATPLRILAAFPLLMMLNNVMGVQWLIPLGFERRLKSITVCSGALRLLACVVLAPHWGEIGAALAYVSTELLTFVWQLYLVLGRRVTSDHRPLPPKDGELTVSTVSTRQSQ